MSDESTFIALEYKVNDKIQIQTIQPTIINNIKFRQKMFQWQLGQRKTKFNIFITDAECTSLKFNFI
jgi:hypothetical protein